MMRFWNRSYTSILIAREKVAEADVYTERARVKSSEFPSFSCLQQEIGPADTIAVLNGRLTLFYYELRKWYGVK